MTIPLKYGEFMEDGLTFGKGKLYEPLILYNLPFLEMKKLADDDSYFNEPTLASEALSLSLVSFSDSSFCI